MKLILCVHGGDKRGRIESDRREYAMEHERYTMEHTHTHQNRYT